MNQFVCLDDFEEYARRNMDPLASKYFYSGSDNEITLHRNRSAFRNIFLKPKNLSEPLSDIELKTELLNGRVTIDCPIGIAPTAFVKMANIQGETAIFKAGQELGTVMVNSVWSSVHPESLALNAQRPELVWQNTYIFKDRAKSFEIAKETERLGCGALVITCDIPVLSLRKAYLPQHGRLIQMLDQFFPAFIPRQNPAAYYAGDPDATWKDFEAIAKSVRIPIVAKGITTAEDARKAMEHGANAIWVSTHGGRQLDGMPASIEVLSEVVKEVDGKVDVYVDGGIRTGNDAFKALALGAKAVFLGRPIISGLTCNGENGIKDVVGMVRDELKINMALTGCPSLEKLNRSYLWEQNFSRI